MSFSKWLSSVFKKHSSSEGLIETFPPEVKRAAIYFKESGERFENVRHIAEIDYSINSRLHRLFIYDRNLGKLYKFKVAHGSGGKNLSPHDGVCRQVSNLNDSHMSCLGAFRTGETYTSAKVGFALRLHGLSPSNVNALDRGVVIHGSDYVSDKTNAICGRSWGCPAVDHAALKNVIGALKGGALVYSHHKGKFSI